jgi:hypothetical protein
MTAYNIVNPASLVAGQPEDISQVLANFQAIASTLNGHVDATNLDPTATITATEFDTANIKHRASDILFGGDANLYRVAGPALKTDFDLAAVQRLHANYGTANEVEVGYNGTGAAPAFAFSNGSGGWDTNLYRAAANTLRTDGSLLLGSQLIANVGLANQIALSSDGRLYFGSAADTNLYRAGAGTLKTDGGFQVGGSLVLFSPTASGWMQQFYAPGDTQPRHYVGWNGDHLWGPGGSTVVDTSLYRPAANTLKTDGNLCVMSHFQLGSATTGDSTAGARTYRFPVYNQNDTILGYVQIYT